MLLFQDAPMKKWVL